ncbi:MAG: YcgN family cysteine cluster protein [Pseudomonadota bacterium]|nr:YcgN family cysteine cluster protein [Pseudomonadota bacterium]MED5473585.1 YcgN family cysteine cluster protein [Pseudomonadota bacterium]
MGHPTEQNAFWKTKTLRQMSSSEWEALCDGCGKCCLIKLIDDLTDDLHYTTVACKLLDCDSCRCGDYNNRKKLVEDCVILSPRLVEELHWMPSTCAYRLIYEGKDLYWWHPLVSGNPNTVHEAGISVKGRAISEREVKDSELPNYINEFLE